MIMIDDSYNDEYDDHDHDDVDHDDVDNDHDDDDDNDDDDDTFHSYPRNIRTSMSTVDPYQPILRLIMLIIIMIIIMIIMIVIIELIVIRKMILIKMIIIKMMMITIVKIMMMMMMIPDKVNVSVNAIPLTGTTLNTPGNGDWLTSTLTVLLITVTPRLTHDK